ncbi:polyprenyl synthetase family protein [Guggenheimella bovis]
MLIKTLKEVLLEHSKEGTLRDAMHYSLFAGGKRLRPTLYLMHVEEKRPLTELDYRYASCIECIHTYSLIHDDLPSMDNDTLRRGKPTNHMVYGEAMAILAGDGLFSVASEELFSIATKDPSYLKACKLLVESSGSAGMVYGQSLDILYEGKEIEESILTEIDSYKTAKLITAPIVASGLTTDGDEEELKELYQLGELLGVAFQLQDDLLDVLGKEETLGKSLGKDADTDKQTYLKYYGIEEAKKRYEELKESILTLLMKRKPSDALVDYYKKLLERTY